MAKTAFFLAVDFGGCYPWGIFWIEKNKTERAKDRFVFLIGGGVTRSFFKNLHSAVLGG